MLIDLYISANFDDGVEKGRIADKDSFFSGEIEYILFGDKSDAEKEELDASSMTGILKKVGIGAAIVILVLILLICITRTIGYLQYKKRRKNRRRRRNSSRRRR